MEITENETTITNHIDGLNTTPSWTSDGGLALHNNSSSKVPPTYRLAVMWTIDIIIAISNIPVFIVTPLLKNIPNASKIAMVVLGVSDICVAVHRIIKTTVFASTGNYFIEEGSWLCWLDGTTGGVMLFMSLINLTYISVDRFLQIKYPFSYARYSTKHNIILIELATFIYGVSASLSITAFYPLYFNDTILDCRWHLSGVVGQLVAFTTYFIPGSVIFACIFAIYMISKKQLRSIASQNNADTNGTDNQMRKQTIKVIRTLLVMTIGFYVCWGPVIVVVLFLKDLYGKPISDTTEFFCVWLAYINSAINPWIYIFVIREYRTCLCRIFFHAHTETTEDTT